MAKTMLNQTMSRPILYAYAQEQIAKTPSKWLGEKKKAINEFLATIPKIKQIVTDKISNLTPQEDLDVLAKYDMTEQESCFWFTDTESKDARQDKNSIYANFACNGYGNSYYYNSCHQRARLITPEQLAVFDNYLSKLERIRLKWHKHYEEMKEKFKAYAELIRSSKNLEQVIEVWSEAENVKHKITGTGTALALSSISESIIQQDIAERKLADTVAVVVTPKESVGV